MLRLSAFADEISSDPLEQIECLAAQGISHIEFRSILGTNVLDLQRTQHEEFRQLLGRHGFGLSAIGSPIGKIPIEQPLRPHLDRFAIALDLADFYRAPRIRVFSFYLPPDDDPRTHRAEVIERMTRLTRLAEDRGVILLLENEKGIYGDTAARVADLIETVGSPTLRHAFDPANYVEVGQPVLEAWERLRSHVAHFHVKDYIGATAKHVPAGQGDGRIPEILALAVAAGYSGFVVLEPHLIVAEQSYGFTGPDRFAEAAVALKGVLQARGLPYA
jgi:sugar phosphate isomerase/epimerase